MKIKTILLLLVMFYEYNVNAQTGQKLIRSDSLLTLSFDNSKVCETKLKKIFSTIVNDELIFKIDYKSTIHGLDWHLANRKSIYKDITKSCSFDKAICVNYSELRLARWNKFSKINIEEWIFSNENDANIANSNLDKYYIKEHDDNDGMIYSFWIKKSNHLYMIYSFEIELRNTFFQDLISRIENY